MLNPGFDEVTEIDTDPKGRFVSFKVTPSKDRVLRVYAPSGHSTRKQLARGRFFEGMQTYIEMKTQENENKIILGDFNCTMEKMDRDDGNKTQKLYRCRSNFALSKLIVDNGLKVCGEGRTQVPLSLPATIDLLAQDPGLTSFTLT